ncbi:MAG: ABC transporter substrate-binding protein [Ruminiclostridium sp.]|nr:ABC transporter substrate-binding protein [Ruminiclostridium sp.]
MKKRIFAAFAALCMVLSAAGCGNGDKPAGTEGAAVTGDTSVSGKIVIYTSMYEDIIDDMEIELEKQFPNLEIEFFQGGSGTIQSKIAAEMDSGKLGCDVLMVAEPSYSLELKEAGILEPFTFTGIDKLVFDYDPEGYWYPVRVCNMVLAYNPEKYSKDELPTSFKEFAEDPDMKGCLSMSNPLTSGTAYASVVGLLDKYGEDYFKSLNAQNVAIESGSVALTKLETGECKEIMVLEESVLKKRQEENSKLEIIYPDDGCIPIPSTIMLIDEEHSANQNILAAKAVEKFFLSPEGQKLIVNGWMYSVRKDVTESPYDGLPLLKLTENTIPVDWEKCYKQREEIRTMFQNDVTIPG